MTSIHSPPYPLGPDQVMEMYADVESRGGILEPPGICEVKFRVADQMSKMHAVSCDAACVVRVVFYQ